MHDRMLFLDVECLGLDDAAPVWNVAALEVTNYLRVRWACDLLVEHSTTTDRIDAMPPSFRDDYHARYVGRGVDAELVTRSQVAQIIHAHSTGGTLIAGSNPDFDMRHLARMMAEVGLEPGWHYHPFDVPQMALGYATAKLGRLPAGPWKSDFLSRVIGVDVRDYARHTALGDCEWALAMFQRMSGYLR